MITPDELSNAPLDIVEMYAELEDFIISDMARRISNIEFSATSEKQLLNAIELGFDQNYIEDKIADILKISKKALATKMLEYAKKNISAENKLYKKADMNTFDIKNKKLKQYLKKAELQTKGEFDNITGSLGFAKKENGKIVYDDIANMYVKTANFANMQVATGVTTRQQAVKQAVDKLSKSGLRYVNYESGYSMNVQDAVNMSVRTSINQMCSKMNNHMMNENIPEDEQYAEVTYHYPHRPDHWWGGMVFKVKGSGNGYDNLYDITRLGYGDGLEGYNCRHSHHVFIPGISIRAYTDKQLEQMKEKSKQTTEYNGKQYTAYEATQRQRTIERSIRQTKREILTYQSADLKDDLVNSQIKLQRQKEEYKKFCKTMNLTQQPERTQQYGFGRSDAQKARYATK